MANYYSQFALALKVSKREGDCFLEAAAQYRNAVAAFEAGTTFQPTNAITIALLKECQPKDLIDPSIETSCRSGDGDAQFLWVQDACGTPDLEFTAALLHHWLKHFNRAEAIGFSWSNTSSSPRTDGFGGGAVVIAANGIKWFSTHDWLQQELKRAPSSC